jgi:serine/threonine protein phosphatase PrpC
MFRWHVAALTDKGCHRTTNADAYYISADERVFAVCDGMGGTLGGTHASQLAIATIATLWHMNPPHPTDLSLIREWASKAISAANESIYISAQEDPALAGMGTTIVIAIQSLNREIEIAHVGDSRAYLFRPTLSTDNKLVLLTQDHTQTQGDYRNLTTRCLGHADKIEASYATIQLAANHWIILCSDGLPTVLWDGQIGEVLEKATSPAEACDDLITECIAGGAPDNVTVLAIHYEKSGGDDDDEPPTAPVPLKPKPLQDTTSIGLSLPIDKQQDKT